MDQKSLLILLNKIPIELMNFSNCKIIIGFTVLMILGIIHGNCDDLQPIDKTKVLQNELEIFFSQKSNSQSGWRNLREILLPFFDLRSTNQNKWEKVWINASELEKERILGYLAQYIIYEADRLSLDFSSDSLVYLNKHTAKDRAVVDALINIEKLRWPVSVRFRRSKSSWMIYDVFLDEISLIEAWKKLNNAINSSDSFEIVLKKIKSKNIR